ncbi:hypothetical protein GOP47_0023432 [Adiantum capillus-veneris]|uniref:Vacuolar fusion protein MON1 homolog n=1 Tax=Adiantum capillus-veneris TaxID=13818 RepID=A0A9D4U4I2_ADICA|nr:hypothetical protein GOP47_0023432 [Adiantum capillus-veneris]
MFSRNCADRHTCFGLLALRFNYSPYLACRTAPRTCTSYSTPLGNFALIFGDDDDGPCYLPSYAPEKAEDDRDLLSSEGVNGGGADATSEEGTSEVQEFHRNEDEYPPSQSPSDVNGFKCISYNMKELDLDDDRRSAENMEGSCEQAKDSDIEVEPAAGNGHVEGYKSYASSECGGASKSGQGQDTDLLKRDLIPGKQHQNEDDSSAAWRRHKKHFFILSHAGKPIYSRYGDEHKLAGFSATLQAIMSFVENGGDSIKYVRAGDHQVVFLVKGPVYLVSISSTDEPLRALRRQLDLLHGQLLLILTKSLEKCFVKNANFDLRPLLGGTENVFSSLIHSFSWNPASFLCSYTCLPLSHTARQAAGAALQDVADNDLLFALLLSDSKVISLVGAQKASLHPDDIFLLSNFVSSSESFRTTESFSPVCLPKYNSTVFVYAYVRYLDTDTCLILITKNSEAFFHLKDCRARVESFLMETHVLRDISNSVARGGLRVEDLPAGDSIYGSVPRSKRVGTVGDGKASNSTAAGTKERPGVGGAAGLWHFIYRSVYLDQYVASEFSSPTQTPEAQKRLFRAYERLYASMHGAPGGSHQMQYRRDENHVLLAWSTADFEFFAAFDPLAEKSSAITVCNRVCQWIRDVENDFFFVGASPFNW